MTLKVNPVTPLASPLGEEGHEVAKGVQANWIRGSLLSPMNPVPLPPQGETRNLRRKIESPILHVPLRHSPFGGWRHHLSAPLGSVSLDSQSPTAPCESSSLATASGGTITRAYCRAIYEESVSRCFILPPEQGWQGNTIRKGAKRPENRVTRFPVEKSGAAG